MLILSGKGIGVLLLILSIKIIYAKSTPVVLADAFVSLLKMAVKVRMA